MTISDQIRAHGLSVKRAMDKAMDNQYRLDDETNQLLELYDDLMRDFLNMRYHRDLWRTQRVWRMGSIPDRGHLRGGQQMIDPIPVLDDRTYERLDAGTAYDIHSTPLDALLLAVAIALSVFLGFALSTAVVGMQQIPPVFRVLEQIR